MYFCRRYNACMKSVFCILCLMWCAVGAYCGTDDLLIQLKTEISKKPKYDDQKESSLKELKKQLNRTSAQKKNKQYALCSLIYDQYRAYQYDSAAVYAGKMQQLGIQLNDLPKQHYGKIKTAFILLSSGMFKETYDNLRGIDARYLNDTARLEYYSILTRANYDLAQFDNDRNYSPRYNAVANRYIDSAIAMSQPGSYDRLYLTGYKLEKNKQYQQAEAIFTNLLQKHKLTRHQYAIVASTLSDVYIMTGRQSKSIDLLIQAAIGDIQSSTKETVAMFWLAQQLYKKGDSKNAYAFIQEAMADAEFYGARQRQFQISTVLPIVAAQELMTSESARTRSMMYVAGITVVALLIVLFAFIIFKQLRKVQAKEKIIEDKNTELESINVKLFEDARIKEDYIGYFFNAISGYILKLEKLKHSIDTKLSIKKYDDIQIIINKINIKKEREDLFYTFDHVFLKIFPNFITAFNSLFNEKDQIWPKEHEVLTTDLRIFALVRLGITDTEAIANILEYSEKTIYVYKMRIKAKALIHGDEFDQRIMAIKAVDSVKD
jgi:TolA-binding protein